MALGEVLGERFALEALAGAGAMGEVYRATDRRSGGRVAVKVMPGRQSDDAARFVLEARILADLTHPHIVAYVDHGATVAGTPWLAMEWLEGEDLAARLARGRLGLGDSVKLGLVMAEALGFVHTRGIVHRDLKPSNVFLVGRDVSRAKLLDFGVARVEAAERMTGKGMLLGTPGYMAPEQVSGAATIDARADVFALGCMLFECLTGEPLFTGSSILAVLAKIALAPSPRLRDRLPGVPPQLEELLASTLAKDPTARPANGRVVAEALRALGDLATGVDPAATLEAPAPSPAGALAESEQRAVAVILVGTRAGQGDGVADQPDTIDPATELELRAEAALYGGRVVRLLNGAVAVELSGSGLATDLAAQAARCALALRPYVGGRPIAVALGRAAATGELLHGPAIDRGAKLLARGSSAPGGAPDGIVLLDDVQAGLLEARFEVRQTDCGRVLIGERTLSESMRTLLGKPTPCVGRERELDMLNHLFEACVHERAAHAVVVTAHAGVGKSRLGQEFLRQIRDRKPDIAIWVGRGDSLRAGSALGLLGALLRGTCDLRDGEALELRRARVRARTAERVPEADCGQVADFLGEIVGVPFPDEENPPLRAARKDAALMHEQMRAAFLSFVGAECAEDRPLLIVLEDLHWGDQPTVQFLASALNALRERPLLVLALARPEVSERFPHLWAECGAHEFRLKPLGARAIDRLVRHVLGETVAGTTVTRLTDLSDGNAFYLEELIRWAAESRDNDLPETLVTMVQSRLGALSDEARRTLRVASVFGEVFWPQAVLSLLGGEETSTSLRERLRELVDRELLIRRPQSRFLGDEEYAFRHALLREGAYTMLTDEDRKLGHRLAGQWLEAHGEPDALLLAEHLEKGGAHARAGIQYLLAADRASAGSDTLGALACIERGLALSLPRDLRHRLLGMRCQLHMFRIELAGPGLAHAQALLSDADRGGIPWTQALLLSIICAAQTGVGRDLAEVLEIALGVDFRPEALEAATMVLGFGVAFSDHAGEVRRADVLAARAETLLQSRADAEPSAALFGHLITATRVAFAREDPWAGVVSARRALALALSIGHTRYRLGSNMLILVNSCYLGAHAEAQRAAPEKGVPDHEFGLSSSVRPFVLSWTLADMGSLDEARGWAEHLISVGRSRRLPLDEARGHWALAEVLRRAGDLEKADSALTAALATMETVCPLDGPGAFATLSALRLAQGKRDAALAAAEEGLARFRSIGACGMFRGAFLRLVHAEALRAVGRETEAREALRQARRCILANAEKISDPTFRTSFLGQVPENRRTLELAEQLGDAPPS